LDESSRIRRRAAAFLAVLLALAPVASAEVVVIVHPGNSVEGLSLRDLTRIYKVQRSRWPDGTLITPFLPPRDSVENRKLLERVFQLQSDAALARYYLRAIFQQRIADQPYRCVGPLEAVRRVATERGGIALVEREALPKDAAVRVIAVEGL
jgi:hypothetical protein